MINSFVLCTLYETSLFKPIYAPLLNRSFKRKIKSNITSFEYQLEYEKKKTTRNKNS